MSDVMKKSTELANDLVDSFLWALKKLDNPGRKIDPEKARGETAEVSVPIKAGKTGQILVVLSNTLQHYPARAARADMEFAKGSKVRVCDVGSNMMYVQPVDDTYGTTSGELVEM
ncbi:MAG TPA: hypothetical protein V6C69_02255 [Trichormus sp.]|jgi:hypothetical protein